MKKVLVLTAHPDDLELACGGTVARFVDEGVEVTNLIVCSNVPHKKYVPESSKILGFNPLYLEHRDESITREVVAEIEALINISSYDLLITHWKEDWHQDHRFCHDLGNSLRRKQPLNVWYMNAYPYCQKYTSFEANVFVDITKYIEQKKNSILCYKNVPTKWAKDTEHLTAYRGAFIETQHAEIFKADTLIV